MSIKMFFISTFGLIKPTGKIEKKHEHLLAAYHEYCEVESSEELKKYTELEMFVQSEAFAQKKKEIENLTYKGSSEEALVKEFTALSKNKKLLSFYKTLQSSGLQRFNNIRSSETLANFLELKKFMEDGSFAAEKKKSDADIFNGSPEEKQLNEFKRLQKSKAIKIYFRLNGSADLKKFENFSQSETLKKFEGLKAKVDSGNYLNEKKEFLRLKNDSGIKDYFRFKGSKKYKIYKETAGSQLIDRYAELEKIANAELEKGNKRTRKEKKEFRKTETYSRLREFNRLKKNKKLIIYFQVNDSPGLNQFLAFEQSETLKNFRELEEKIKSGNCINELTDFKKLKNRAEIKAYFRFIRTAEYKIFRETESSKLLARFNELKHIVESEAFLNRKAYLEDSKKFEKTAAFKKSEQYKKLKNSEDIRFYFKYEKSATLKIYLEMENSKERSRFEELKELTASEEFLKRKAYLKDQKKWEKAEEFQKFQEYNEMKKLPHMVRYFRYKNNHELDFFKNWQLVFSDDFSTAKLDNTKWQTISYRGGLSLGKNYSQPGDLQAFTSGENIKTDGKTLKIETRREKIKGMQWQLPFGFIEKEFDYSSGCINSNGSFIGSPGIWEAKVKYKPRKGLVSAVYLEGKDNTQLINLVETGIKNRVGLLNHENTGTDKTTSISGLKPGRFYIFRLEWGKGKMIWKVNNKEILSISAQVPASGMYLNATTIVADEISNGLPYSFEIGWIRFYQQKH